MGGPALTMWLQPTDEELFKRYNPELQKKSLERRYERQKDFDDFVMRLREYSKSDKPSTEPPNPPFDAILYSGSSVMCRSEGDTKLRRERKIERRRHML